MAEIAATIIDADFTVIVDATFLLETQRRTLLEMEVSSLCKRVIVHCEALEEELRKRIVGRENDPSEANLQVLEQQLRSQQPISVGEKTLARVVTIGSDGISTTKIQEIRQLLAN